MIIVGAGAAGLFAAVHAAQQGMKVLIVEKNDRIGKKLAITGKGRCNVTNDCTEEDFLKMYPKIRASFTVLFTAIHLIASWSFLKKTDVL